MFFNRKIPKKLFNNPFLRNISILDIGARDGIGPPWVDVGANNLDITLVEPDPEEALILKRNKSGKVINSALWDKNGSINLNINKSPGTSSVYSANKTFLSQFEEANRFDCIKNIKVKANTIDSIFHSDKSNCIDFVKIDVQGGELSILKGGKNFLSKNIIGLEVEVEFSQLYVNQPLFSDIDIFIRENIGLELWDIRKTYWKYKNSRNILPNKGRLIFGDALYFRPLDTLEEWLGQLSAKASSQKLYSLICSAALYGYTDYCLAIIRDEVSKKYLSKKVRSFLEIEIYKYSKGFYPLANGNKTLFRIFKAISNSFRPSYKRWSIAEPHLGSKKNFLFWH